MKDYEYQQKKLKTYLLPDTVHRQAIWAVKDVCRMREKLETLKNKAYATMPVSLGEHNNGYHISDNTGDYASDISNLSMRVEAIMTSLENVPLKYREGIVNRLIYDLPYDDSYHGNTWRKWQQVFLYYVAINLHIL